LLGSEELNKAQDGQWIQRLISSVTADDEVAPIGGETTAESVAFTANKQSRIEQLVTLVAGTEYTFSVWAKATGGSPQSFRLSYYDNTAGSGARENETAPTSWDATTGRATMTFTAASSGTYWMRIQNASAGAAQSIYFWGAMLNEGAAAGDYIKTTFAVGPTDPPVANAQFGDNFGRVSAYYSLRQFTTAEETNAIRVRRSSDDTEQDIGFDANGDLDTTALLAFVGTGGTDNGAVTTFYDQSGNGNDATNATESEQPLVVSGGTLVTIDGYPCLDGDIGADTMLQALDVIDTVGDVAIFSTYALKTDGTTANQITFEIGNGTSSHRIHDTLGRGGAGTFGIDIRGATNYDFGNATGVAVDDIYLNSILSETNGFYINGTQQTSNNAVRSGSTVDALTLFNRGGGAFPYKGKFFEFIFFASDQSSNRTGIETNIDTYFDIV